MALYPEPLVRRALIVATAPPGSLTLLTLKVAPVPPEIVITSFTA